MDKRTDRKEKAKFWKMTLENMIKYEFGSNQTKLLKELVKEYGWAKSNSSFSARLNKGSLTLVELSEILEHYDKTIKIV